MTHRRALAALALAAAAALAPAADPPARPKLAVLVVFDQFRGDYLARFRELFVPDGFRRLLDGGAHFTECLYPYANTATGPGHASVLTGCSPDRHGILHNYWYDRAEGGQAYCATEPRYDRVPPATRPTRPGKPAKKEGSGSPGRMLAPTLGEALKEATRGRGRVVALSMKDRGAALPAGKKADAVYWFDPADGLFVTSTFYRDAPHGWVKDLNASGMVRGWAGKAWDRLRPELDYARYAGRDDQPGEAPGAGHQGVTFPHPFGPAGDDAHEYFENVYTSPMGNEVLLDLVGRMLAAEKLGRADAPDLLSVSFSCNDPIGHAFGPDSQEVMDVTLRSDLIVRDLLALLDAHAGKGNYTLALTADHGVCPLPEVSAARGIDARRWPAPALAEAEAHLAKAFGAAEGGRWVEAVEFPMYYLNRRLIEARGLPPAEVEAALAAWLRGRPGVAAAYTRTQLLGELPPGDEVGRLVKKSFHPGRGPDVQVVARAYSIMHDKYGSVGSTHVTPHRYDRHVPLVVYGPGVRPGPRADPVTPQAAAAILAHALGVRPPAAAEAPVPDGLFAE